MKDVARISGFTISKEMDQWMQWRKGKSLKTKAAQFRDMAKNEMEIDKRRNATCKNCSKLPWLCQCSSMH